MSSITRAHYSVKGMEIKVCPEFIEGQNLVVLSGGQYKARTCDLANVNRTL
jgi:hypothetical protein